MRGKTLPLFEDIGLPVGRYKTKKGWSVFVFSEGFSLLFLKKRVLSHRYDEAGRAWLRKRGQWRGVDAGYAPLSWSLSLSSFSPFAYVKTCPLIDKLEKEAGMNPILAKRQQELLFFLHQYQTENYISPSIREMCEKMGILSSNGVSNHLLALERKGYIEKIGKGKSRAWRLTAQGQEYVKNHAPVSDPQEREELFVCGFCSDFVAETKELSITPEETKLCCPSCLQKLALIGARFFLQLGGGSVDWLVGYSLESMETAGRGSDDE